MDGRKDDGEQLIGWRGQETQASKYGNWKTWEIICLLALTWPGLADS